MERALRARPVDCGHRGISAIAIGGRTFGHLAWVDCGHPPGGHPDWRTARDTKAG